MTFRTEADLVYASNAARDLTNLVQSYLFLWRKYANGKNGVTVPDTNFSVVFMPPDEGYLRFAIIYTDITRWQEPHYYDVDSDYFQEGYGCGDSNISGYSTRTVESISSKTFRLPFSCLLKSKEEMENSIKTIAKAIEDKEKEQLHIAQIAELEDRLLKLKS